ncbi:MerR family transcriptional regulator [Streptacidiphilus jiangxiensis]|uniref:MerR HTH family regulatory protein n=1 Tax=Streptacidiphilus jiangxiensis TaxID=235985 RepID=A0A1H7ZDQ8_STRJI|nr:MerR family transcriptional regulator [Streptacidiphilus jiangxiensis]SEM55607.1 MerR HTH family regulatory protein [Streptacidiphilus jiangxiensis]
MTPHRSDTAREAGLPTGEVARRLGVSPVTLRSWERRYGIGPAARDHGHHRRWTPADIARLEGMCALTARGLPPAEAARICLDGPTPAVDASLPATAPGQPDRREPTPHEGMTGRVRGLVRAADRLDAPTVQALLAAAVDELGVEAAWEEVIAPSLRAAGRRWAAVGESYIEVEHLLSWHVSAELRRRAVPIPRSGPVALLAAAPGEDHTLPLDALAAALTARGIAFRMLGASVPPAALAQGLRRLGPAAVLLWSQTRATAAPQIAADILTLPFGVAGARRRPLLLLAGPGWHPLPPTGAAVKPASLRGAVDRIAATTGALTDPSASIPSAST